MSEWRDIPGYARHYQISDEGVVRIVYPNDGTSQRKNTKILRPFRNPFLGDQPFVHLRRKDGIYGKKRIVSLMRDVWLGGKREGLVVAHRDGNTLNNAAYNLYFTTRQEIGKIGSKYKRKPIVKVDKDGTVLADYPSIRVAAEKEYASRACIQNIVNGASTGKRLTGGEYTYMLADEYYGR